MTNTTLYCSFCGKSQHEVAKLVAGPSTFICDECVDLCGDIVGAERLSPEARIMAMVRELRNKAEVVSTMGKPKTDNNYGRAAEALRLCLPSDHPMHPNQDQDDVPELGDPRA